jgi:hypothetical protein
MSTLPGDSGHTKTATITFGETTFMLSILPSHRVLISVNDSVFVSDWPDTSFSGTYYFSGDSLFLKTNSKEQRFFYSLSADTLGVTTFKATDPPGPVPVLTSTFLWGYSKNKFAGKFSKVSK